MNQEIDSEPSSRSNRISNILDKQAFHLVCLAVVIYTIIFSYFTILKYFSFQAYAGDLGIFEQSLWSTLHGFFLYNTPEFGTHFRMHFDPILFLLLPIYAIYQSPLTLLVLQSIFLALGAIPVYLLAKYELKNKFSGFIFAFLYLMYPPLQGINWFDFHPECLAPVLLISAFYCLKREKFLMYFIFLVIALSCKEIIALIVSFMGLYGFWFNRRKIINCLKAGLIKEFLTDRIVIVSILTILLGVAWYILALRIIGMYNVLYNYNEYVSWSYLGLGFGLPSILLNIITHPLYVLQLMFTPFSSKVFYLWATLGPLAFLSLLNPMSFLISAPWLFASLLSQLPNYYLPVGNQYPAILVPFVFISAIYGAKTLQPAVKRGLSYLDKEKPNPKLLDRTILKIVREFVERPILVILILLFTVGMLFAIAYAPLNSNTAPSYTVRDQVLEAVVQTISPYTLVAIQNDIFPHISHNLLAYPVYYKEIPFEYILVNNASIWYYIQPYSYPDIPIKPIAFSSVIPNLISSGEYGTVISINGIMLLKRGYTGPPLIQI